MNKKGWIITTIVVVTLGLGLGLGLGLTLPNNEPTTEQPINEPPITEGKIFAPIIEAITIEPSEDNYFIEKNEDWDGNVTEQISGYSDVYYDEKHRPTMIVTSDFMYENGESESSLEPEMGYDYSVWYWGMYPVESGETEQGNTIKINELEYISNYYDSYFEVYMDEYMYVSLNVEIEDNVYEVWDLYYRELSDGTIDYTLTTPSGIEDEETAEEYITYFWQEFIDEVILVLESTME